MLDTATELRLVHDRLQSAMKVAQLSNAEIEILLDLPKLGWTAICKIPSSQAYSRGDFERRARLAIELVSELCTYLGGAERIRTWLLEQAEELDGFSPLGWIAGGVEHLQALVAALRHRGRVG